MIAKSMRKDLLSSIPDLKLGQTKIKGLLDRRRGKSDPGQGGPADINISSTVGPAH